MAMVFFVVILSETYSYSARFLASPMCYNNMANGNTLFWLFLRLFVDEADIMTYKSSNWETYIVITYFKGDSMKFKELNIIPPILKALEGENYTQPTPIQEKAIPPILNGKDLLGCAQTGTGKTAAFAVPTLQLLYKEVQPQTVKRRIRALILTPTREVAAQICDSVRVYGRYTNLRGGVIFGGVSQRPQEMMLQRGVDILVATPGRLNDLMNQKLVDLQFVEVFILDEADRMLDMGFIHDVKKIISKMPSKKQTLLFSATIPPEISELANSLLDNPVKIAITPVSSAVDTIKQYLYFVDKGNKVKLLLSILKNDSASSALVFTRTKYGADKVVRDLTNANVSALAIHGNKSQNARQLALSNFKSRVTRVLVATDIAARGIDINELPLVVNFDLPNIPETYVHRIGRTGRAGLSGTAISFCDIEEKPYLADIEKLLGKHIAEIADNPYPMMITTPPSKNAVPRRNPSQTVALVKHNQRKPQIQRNHYFKKPHTGKNVTGMAKRKFTK